MRGAGAGIAISKLMGILALTLVLAWAPTIHAGELYKCVGKSGAVRIQDRPCEAEARTAWIKPADPDLRTPEEWARLRERQARDVQGSRYLSRIAGTDKRIVYIDRGSSRSVSVDKCTAAKRHRDAVLKTAGLKAGFDLHRQLNSLVYDAGK